MPIRLTNGDVCSKIFTVKPFKHKQLLYSLMSMGRSCPSLERPSADLCKLVTMQQHLTRHTSSASQTPLAEPTDSTQQQLFRFGQNTYANQLRRSCCRPCTLLISLCKLPRVTQSPWAWGNCRDPSDKMTSPWLSVLAQSLALTGIFF